MGEAVIAPSREAFKTNAYDIVLPPPFSDCIGKTCPHRRTKLGCHLSRHHVQAGSSRYEAVGGVAATFYDAKALSVWLPRCRHEEEHDKHLQFTKLPNLAVMRQCIEEARLLSSLKHLNDRMVENRKSRKRERREYRKRFDAMMEHKEELLAQVETIEVIPEALVTGSLLLTAPEVAKRRVLQGSPYAMTATTPKAMVPDVLGFAQAIISQAA